MEDKNMTNGYIGFCNGEQAEIYANSLYEAKQKTVEHFKTKHRRWTKALENSVHVHLCELEGEQVVHTADF
jgi:predicted small metal-binding protein